MIELTRTVSRVAESARLKAGEIDIPTAGMSTPGYGLEIVGWALASDAKIDRIEILHGDVVLRTTELTEAREDVSRAFGLPLEATTGFRTRITLVGLPLRPTLRVAARIGDERVDLAELVLRRDPLRVSSPPTIHPLIVTTMGRTGSVWFSHLVGEHPSIVSYRPFQYEPRVGSYWAHVLRALADPASVVQGLAPLEMGGEWWLGQRDLPRLPRVLDEEIAEWLSADHVEGTARFCLESAAGFYSRVAGVQGKDGALYYAEKYMPAWVPSTLLELDAGAKEVFLVRDPRDQLASVVSWTTAGRARFSENATTAEEYLDWLGPRTKALLAHWRARSSTSLLVRYEDLVLRPVATLGRLFEYLEVDSSPETVTGVLDSAQKSGQKLQRGHQTSKDPKQSVGRWQNDVDPDLWVRVNEVFAPELEAWYSDSPMPEATAV